MRWTTVSSLAAILVAVTIEAQAVAPQDSTTKSTGTVEGAVIDAVSGRPIAGATVTLTGPGVPQSLAPAVTGQGGSFRFDALPAGRFSLASRNEGYIAGRFGQRYPDDTDLPITLANGERRSKIELRLWPVAVLWGSVVGPQNEPLARVRVTALRSVFSRGRFELRRRVQATTDDRGQYRLSVPPGQYVVALEPSAASPPAGQPAYPALFHPGLTSTAGVNFIDLRGGENQGPVDFKLPAAKSYRVSGRLESGEEKPAASVRVSLVSDEPGAIPTELDMAPATVSQGQFTFPAVFPGRYLVRAIQAPRSMDQVIGRVTATGFSMSGGRPPMIGAPLPPLPDSPTLWAEASIVVVDKDVTGVPLVMRSAAHLTGEVVFRGNQQPDSNQLQASSVIVTPVDGRDTGIPITRIEADRTFRTVGLPPAPYVLTFLLSFPGYTMQALQVGGVDMTGRPIDVGSQTIPPIKVLMTERATELRGTVRNAQGQPIEGASVYIFPADRSAWVDYAMAFPLRWRTARSSRDGSFEVKGLVAGRYAIAAVEGSVPEVWQEPKSLDWLSMTGQRLGVAEGQVQTVSIQTTKWVAR
ncbi:MAG TPA: carboxypeptidase-like regulatory domain-containing protein [Vicinamibacterales bacterium]|nr:carboxypeptidase-like regulatory domain-containing protein [Vicinamibacterales bacterium]